MNISDLYFSALQGDVRSILQKTDSFPDAALDKEQLDFKQKYKARFVTGTEVFDYRTSDSLVIGIIRIYIGYWQNVLLKKQTIETADSMLSARLAQFTWENHYSGSGISRDTIDKHVFEYAEKLLGTKGIGVANGKTAGIYDLLAWGKESRVNYRVRLPETKIGVNVVFMENIISMGWEEYATFGRYFPGGWATSDALFCTKSTYDLESENFKVSYLQHEGQHFADYMVYPELSGADLEYRAKLVEFCYSKETTIDLVGFFIRNASRDRNNAHAFANSCVIRDLSRELFHEDLVTDLERWKKMPNRKINRAASILLAKNSEDLKKAGGKTVKEYIR
ncbi:MAG: hypothetical protein FD123_2681 [Bacteroidetes bacterium]|nr:MAG: hypothetical protein FD123_2681 [Bacteroidota bacterium]